MSATEAAAPVVPDAQLREQLHEFHLTGRPLDIPDPLAGKPLRPLAFTRGETPPQAFPLCYQEKGSARFRPLASLLGETLASGGFELLADHGALLAQTVGVWLAEQERFDAPLAEAVAGALEVLRKRSKLQEEDPAALEAENQRLLARLPHAVGVLGVSPEAAITLHIRTLADSREDARKSFVERVRGLLQQMEGLLGRGDEPEGSGALASELGGKADRYLNAGALARSLRRTPGHRALEPQRRERIESAARTLRGLLERESSEPMLKLFHSPKVPTPPPAPGVVRLEVDDPIAEALKKSREEMEWFSEALRALRLAALEAQNDYRPELHDRALARFDWTAATPEEAAAAPVCVAAETADRVANRSLTALGRALRSGLPIHILALRDASVSGAEGGPKTLQEPSPDLGYLAIAHREAFVLEAPLAEAETLLAGFERLNRRLRPALAVVAVPRRAEQPAAALEQARAAWRARATPALLYDPEAGESWAERFSLDGNLDLSSLWAGGTPADAAALDPAYRACFAALPPESEDDEQIPLTEYLEQTADRRRTAMPYILLQGPHDHPVRAVITRPLVNLCRDLARAWRIYQELAGVQNAYVDSAVAGAREKVRLEFEQEREQSAAAARREGAQSAVYRLVASLAGADTLPAPVSAAVAAAAPAPSEESPQPAAEPAAAPARQPAAPPPTGPYIESALCTSCDECINRNPKMFRYNENHQAYIADPKAGTYQQLMKAAAACPAQCIHPGPPPE